MSGKAIRETLGFLAVVASLLFVGWEIRQNNAIARAQTRQSLMENYLQWNMSMAGDAALTAAYREAFFDDPISPFGRTEQHAMWVHVRMMENVFLQVHEGVVDESVFSSYGWADSATFGQQKFAEWWTNMRHRFHPDFVAVFEAENGLGA